MRPSSESPILDSTGLRRVGHDKRGGAATRIGTREALRCGDASGDATGARVTRNSIPLQISWYAFLFISWDACMSCMHVMLVSPARRRIGLDSTGRGVAPAALRVRVRVWVRVRVRVRVRAL